jgi:hypothetical protein
MNELATFGSESWPKIDGFAAHKPGRAIAWDWVTITTGASGVAVDGNQVGSDGWSFSVRSGISLESLEKTVFPFASGCGLKYRWGKHYDGLAFL